jgi:Fe-Mn family superoxide dismutase
MSQPTNRFSSRRKVLGQALSAGLVGLGARRAFAGPKEEAKPSGKPGAAATPSAAPAAAAAPVPPPSHPSLALAPLPYAENALDPVISANTLAVHHGKHHKAYYDKTNTFLVGTPLLGKPLEEIVKAAAADPKQRKLFNNAAQAWNHAFYWQSMKPKGGGAPTGALAKRIEKDFGSYDAFKAQFIQAGVDHFSNGWVWLVLDGAALKIIDTHDAETPLVRNVKPLAVADVWEHAYYLDYKNLRKDYVTGFVDHLLNWDFVAKNLG